MPPVTVNGVSVYYEDQGRGVPFLLTHGFAGTTRMWDGQVPSFSRDRRLITWDLRGHGQSDSPPRPGDYACDLLVEDLHQLFLHLKVDRAIVGGLSYGGYLSLHFYYRYPEMVKALILIDTGPGYRTPDRAADWNAECEARARVLESQGIAGFLASRYAGFDYYTTRDVMNKLNPLGLANFSRGAMTNPHGVDRLKDIAVPTLIVVGENDRGYLAAADVMAAKIPNAEKAVIANAGHGVNIDQPREFEKVVLDFLERIGV